MENWDVNEAKVILALLTSFPMKLQGEFEFCVLHQMRLVYLLAERGVVCPYKENRVSVYS